MKSITAEQYARVEIPYDMDDAFIALPDPYNPGHPILREVWDVLRERDANNNVILLVAPDGAEHIVRPGEAIYYS